MGNEIKELKDKLKYKNYECSQLKLKNYRLIKDLEREKGKPVNYNSA